MLPFEGPPNLSSNAFYCHQAAYFPIHPCFKNTIIMDYNFLGLFLLLCLFPPDLNAQQEYSANSVLDCNNTDDTGPSTAFLYACNRGKSPCQAFLIFKAQPPYNSITTISNLTSSDPSELARANNVTEISDFPTDKEVLVPVNCSCSGQYYQAKTSYVIKTMEETYFEVANNTYQGLSTCSSLMRQNVYGELDFKPGFKLGVPLRCACPTSDQSANGTKYLLSYLVSWGDNVPDLSRRFNVSTKSVLVANGFSEDDPTLFPFTTLLIPLPAEPSSSETIIHDPLPPTVTPPAYVITPVEEKKGSKKGLRVGVGIAAGFSLLSFILLSGALYMIHKKSKKTERSTQNRRGGKMKSVLPEDILAGIANVDQGLKVFGFDELKVATDNFSPKNRVKGSVYRGVISGEVLAIKRMSRDASKEVNILSKVNHFNLMRCYGICGGHGSFYLVLEYMQNSSLRDWLHERECPEVHRWTQRVQIALDVANGLHYLHSFTEPPYLHLDIKSSNVLLNGSLRAKISNFSLAKSADREGNHASTRGVLGTRGYMAPECLEGGLVTPKIDVYAFGVVMLELLTGEDAIILREKRVLLSAEILSVMEGENAEEELGHLIDPRLQGSYRMELGMQITKLSVACLRIDPASRPTMGDVVSTLSRIHTDSQRWEFS